MTIEEMKRRKQELGYSNEKISELSGVPLGTVHKVFGGATKAPRGRTIQALEKVLAPRNVFLQKEKAIYNTAFPERSEVREESIQYGTSPKKRHTLDDYYQLPEDVRVELIDGEFYAISAPSLNHQAMLLELAMQFEACRKEHRMDCRVLFAPCDVQLDRDRFTMVQPDLLVVCDQEKLQKRVCYGAPDLTLEIMSPASRSLDSIRKLHKYKAAGVLEYWLVDPENETVLVYDFSDGDRFRLYTFHDRVPVGISDGKCEIDFEEVRKVML